jgi:hypothetical protein
MNPRYHIDNVYRIPHLRVTGRIALTNLPSNTAFRGFGGPQGMMVGENIIDHVARALALPVEDVRLRNMYTRHFFFQKKIYGKSYTFCFLKKKMNHRYRAMGDKTHFGQAIEPFQVPRTFFFFLYIFRFYNFFHPKSITTSKSAFTFCFPKLWGLFARCHACGRTCWCARITPPARRPWRPLTRPTATANAGCAFYPPSLAVRLPPSL